MSASPDDAALAAEFEAFALRAELVIPDDRRDLVFAAFKEMRGMLPLLRQPRTAANEPANCFDILSVTRSLQA